MSNLTLDQKYLEDIQELNSDEEQAAQILQEIFDKWSYVTVNEENDELRGPATRKEVIFAQEHLNTFFALAVENEELVNFANELKTITEESKVRRFIGSWLIIGGVSLFLLIAIYSFGISDMTKDFSLTESQRRLDTEINYIQRDIDRLKNYETLTEDQQGFLNSNINNLTELKALDAESYREKRLDEAFWRGFRFTMGKIPMILIVVAYFFASKAPEYLINKRERELQLMSKGAGVAKKVLLGIMGFFLATPWVTFYDVHSDGSKSYSDSNLSSGVLQLVWKFGVPLLIAFFVIYTMMVILPFLTIISYLRNYQADKIDIYVDKLKGVFGKPKIA
jgi:hypothetical protein